MAKGDIKENSGWLDHSIQLNHMRFQILEARKIAGVLRKEGEIAELSRIRAEQILEETFATVPNLDPLITSLCACQQWARAILQENNESSVNVEVPAEYNQETVKRFLALLSNSSRLYQEFSDNTLFPRLNFKEENISLSEAGTRCAVLLSYFLDHFRFPRVVEQRSILSKAVEAAGGFPCAVWSNNNLSFPVIIMGQTAKGKYIGFPTESWEPSGFYETRTRWFETLEIPAANKPVWSSAQAEQVLLAQAITKFEAEYFPDLAAKRVEHQKNSTHISPSTAAKTLEVSSARLSRWAVSQGLMEFNHKAKRWFPRKELGQEVAVFSYSRFSPVPSYLWSTKFIDGLKSRVEEIKMAPQVPQPVEPPSAKQIEYATKLGVQLDVEIVMPQSREEAKVYISTLKEQADALREENQLKI